MARAVAQAVAPLSAEAKPETPAAAAKRGPGRPRKTPLAATPGSVEPSVVRTRLGARTPAAS